MSGRAGGSNWKPGGGCKPADSAAKMVLSSAVLACCHKSSHHIPSGFHRNNEVPVSWKAAADVRTYECNSLRLAYSFVTWLETRLHSSFSPLPRPVTWLEACSDCLEACGHKSKKAPLNAHGLVLVNWGGTEPPQTKAKWTSIKKSCSHPTGRRGLGESSSEEDADFRDISLHIRTYVRTYVRT